MINKMTLASINEPGFSQEKLGYDEAVRLTESEIKRLLRTAPPLIRPQTSHLAQATGKGIRARALLACAMDDTHHVSRDAVNAAAAIELLHLATLVHDDIIDDADMRRGIDALHVKFGSKLAVLCGDYLMCLAMDLASQITVSEINRDKVGNVLPSYFKEICLGEIRELSHTGDLDLTENEYFTIISGKTAALFQATFHAGYLLSDEPVEVKELYIELGNRMGIIFQLTDDCLDFVSSRKTVKKPVLTDRSRGVMTLPLIYALKTDKTLRKRLEGGLSEQDLKDAVLAAGGIEYTRSKIEESRSKAEELIAALGSENKRMILGQLLDKASAF